MFEKVKELIGKLKPQNEKSVRLLEEAKAELREMVDVCVIRDVPSCGFCDLIAHKVRIETLETINATLTSQMGLRKCDMCVEARNSLEARIKTLETINAIETNKVEHLEYINSVLVSQIGLKKCDMCVEVNYFKNKVDAWAKMHAAATNENERLKAANEALKSIEIYVTGNPKGVQTFRRN
jgi:hypothetical protein